MAARLQLKPRIQALVGRMLKMVPYAELVKERRSMLGAGLNVQGQRHEPEWDYEKLLALAEGNWVLNMVYDAIIREALSPGWRTESNFASKCTNPDCGKQFETETQQCDVCGTVTRPPDVKQRLKLENFLQDPNPDNELGAIMRSLMWQALAVDDWFLSINYGTVEVDLQNPMLPGMTAPLGVAKEIWVEDSAKIKILADNKGRLGSNEYFCPTCYGKNNTGDQYWGPDQLVCPTCGSRLEETAYVQVIHGAITARFTRTEIVHGNRGTNLPRLFGRPKLIALLRLILSMQYMDRYNLAAYSSGNLKGILTFPKMDKTAVNELKAEVEAQIQEFQTDPETGERTRPNMTLWLGTAEQPSLLNTLPPSKDMQSLDWYKFYREAVAAVYSVTPVFVSIIESGKSGNNPRMQIDVQNRATMEWQQSFEEPFNNQVLPAFGITDWDFKFNDVDPEDAERDARIQQMQAQAANVFAAAGFTVTINEDGELDVSGEATRPVVGTGQPGAAAGQDTAPIATPGNLMEKATRKRYIIDEYSPSGPSPQPPRKGKLAT